MSIVTLLPFIVLIGAMFLMTRSAKKKQAAAASMRNDVQPGVGVRTIGGMFATVKEVHDEMVLLEVAPGVHAVYAKNAIGAVLDDEEYNRIVHGEEPSGDLGLDAPVVPDDASSLTDGDVAKIDLGKKPGADLTKSDAPSEDGAKAAADDAGDVKDDEPKDEASARDAKGEAKTDGETGTK
ncbi:preprotein translocase subunit YajC [Streptomyces fuscigenes]|uniref:preprotein translocase subunit YajC n=1 Tax=Streptomyces fuscigenes TaxID=1528880 RepID=UPI001F40C154|nr:preprotein translocase subunit YajC [Streptomyces fuscigenes]MCF3961514.1 preprotein translocase subunit YajC [Streptomyces fuscigenes]